MKLYNLGKVPWLDSQLLYHTLARQNEEALCLVSPSTPYVCLGYHQDLEEEVDLAYCQERNLPVFRREVGGGAVYLDGNQFFYQLILGRDHPAVPRKKEAFYRKFLEPVIQTYRRVGVPAELKPINDVIVRGRKIAGTGVGEIGDSIVFVGNLILDFDYQSMARVLKVPDEKFRDHVHQTLKDNLTTLRRELGDDQASWLNEERLNGLLVEEFGKLLGPFVPAEPTEALQTEMKALAARMTGREWLYRKGRRPADRQVRIREGVSVVSRLHKAVGGLIRFTYEDREGRFGQVSISGDFFCYPEEGLLKLEEALSGKPVSQADRIIEAFYGRMEWETPGIVLSDWQQVFSPGDRL